MLPNKTMQTAIPERGRGKVQKLTTNMKRALLRKLETLRGGEITNNAKNNNSLAYFPRKLLYKN